MDVRMTRNALRGRKTRPAANTVRVGGALLVGSALLGSLLTAGCMVQIGPQPTPPAPATTFTVHLVNHTGKPLDPQVYVGRVADGRAQLFASVNERTDFGVGTRGVLLANDQTQFDITCGEPVYVGTLGGIYGDNLNAPDGQGQMIILEEGASIHCGDSVTFTYSVNRSGALVTTYSVTPQ